MAPILCPVTSTETTCQTKKYIYTVRIVEFRLVEVQLVEATIACLIKLMPLIRFSSGTLNPTSKPRIDFRRCNMHHHVVGGFFFDLFARQSSFRIGLLELLVLKPTRHDKAAPNWVGTGA